MRAARKALLFWPLVATLFLADCATKDLAESHLVPSVPEEVVGDYVRLTLGYNPGAATGLTVGRHSRVVFSLGALVAIVILTRLYHRSDGARPGLVIAIALVVGGAAGNLADRVRSARGVVDFIDIGVGGWRFWTFNVADVGVVCGALLLAWYLGRDRPAPPEAA